MTLVPAVNLFFATIVAAQGDCLERVRSLCACLDVVELLATIKNTRVAPRVLREAVDRHMAFMRAAYGSEIDRMP